MSNAERLKGIDVFVATVAAGSFTAAADRLNLTSSAVGKAVARLEARLGQRLLERSTRHLGLTDAGAAFHQICVRVLDELEAAERVMASHDLEPSGRLRIDLPATFGRLKVMPMLARYATLHAAVRPHVSFTDRFVDVIDEGIDVAVRIGGPDAWPANLGHRFLGLERLTFCASPSYLHKHGTPASLPELWQHAAVAYGKSDGTASPWLISDGDAPVQRHAIDAPRIVLGNADAQLDAVMAGLGIAQLATWLADEHIAAGRLVPVLPDHAVDGLPLHLVWPLGKQLVAKVDSLVKYLADGLTIR
ncbi:MAG: LysR family transcriptional regulator [Caulobacter sp.]|nr:LysR family transcriptional regulator [Vitreoscilla sp.]